MKPRWLAALLVLSLAGNALELGLFVKRSWVDIRHLLVDRWEYTTTSSYKFEPLGDRYSARFDSLVGRDTRLVIEAEALDPESAAARIDSMVRERARLRREMMRVVYLSGRDLATIADSAQRRRQTMRWRDMMDIIAGEKPRHADARRGR